MKRKLSTKQILLSALLVLFMLVPFASAHTVTVPTNVYFGLPSYSTYINFNTQQTFDTAYRESSYWYFDGYGFQIQNGNMTITDLFVSDSNKLTFIVSASSGETSTTKVYVGDKGKPRIVRMDGITQSYGDIWTYDEDTKITSLSNVHSSSSNVVLDWSEEGLPSDGEEPRVKHRLTVTVVDENGVLAKYVKVSILKGTTSIASKSTNIYGVAEFSLEPDKYTAIAETSISIGTATVNLSRDRSVTISLAKKPVRHDFLEDVIEPVQSLVSAHLIFFTIASFLSIGLAVVFIGFGFSEDEIALKVAGVLVGVLGVATLIFILSGG